MSALTLVHPPSLAGGPLRHLNRLLHACARARAGSGPPVELVLDDALSRERDRGLLLLNAFGDPVWLPGPRNGVFTAAERAALAAAARGLMPPTAAAGAAIERLLPAPGADPLAAADDLWRGLLGAAGVRVRTRRSGEPPAVDTLGAAPAATWFGARHLQLLRQLQLPPAAALAGEEALRAAAGARQGGALLEETRAMSTALERHLRTLEDLVAAEDAGLLGTWSRLRRQTKRALAEFRARAERNARNRSGIRGARLHALAQALRPLDRPQEEHLGLLAAAALFGLDLDRLPEAAAAFLDRRGRQDLLLSAESLQQIAEDNK